MREVLGVPFDPMRDLAIACVVSALTSGLVAAVTAGYVANDQVDDIRGSVAIARAVSDEALSKVGGSDDTSVLTSRLDLHTRAIDYADLGTHWWCVESACTREKSDCETFVAMAPSRGLTDVEGPCIPRRNAYCKDKGASELCFPVLSTCAKLGGVDDCRGVE